MGIAFLMTGCILGKVRRRSRQQQHRNKLELESGEGNQQQTHYTENVESVFSDMAFDDTNSKQYRTEEDDENSLHTEPDEDEGYETDETGDSRNAATNSLLFISSQDIG